MKAILDANKEKELWALNNGLLGGRVNIAQYRYESRMLEIKYE